AGLSGGGDLLSDRGGAGTWRSCRPVHHVDRAQLLQRAADPGSHRVRAPFRRDRHSVPETWAAPPCERRCGRTSDQSSAVEVLADVRQLNGAVAARDAGGQERSEEHTSELQSRLDLVCRLLLEKKIYTIVHFTQYKLISHEKVIRSTSQCIIGLCRLCRRSQ